MSAITELIVTYQGKDYPVDTAEFRFKEARHIRRWLNVPPAENVRNVWAQAFDARNEDAAACLVWMALHRAGEAPDSIDDLEDFDLGDFFRLADPDGYAEAVAAAEVDDATPTRSDEPSESPT
jgi:hypothetical protein